MVDICPTIDAEDPETYRKQVERIALFAHRVHIDLGDGEFTPNKLVPIDEVWWPGGVRADLHVMFERPFEHVDALIALGPQLIIVQAEAEGEFGMFAEKVRRHGIEVGVALLQDTSVDLIKPALGLVDHVLIFSGNLGYQGGSDADLGLLEKAKAVKSIRSTIEIGWDGGVNDQNIKQLVEGGVEVVNVGGFIQSAHDAAKAYESLSSAANPSQKE
jgi:ribulose-phosphate 3-epimerase